MCEKQLYSMYSRNENNWKCQLKWDEIDSTVSVRRAFINDAAVKIERARTYMYGHNSSNHNFYHEHNKPSVCVIIMELRFNVQELGGLWHFAGRQQHWPVFQITKIVFVCCPTKTAAGKRSLIHQSMWLGAQLTGSSDSTCGDKCFGQRTFRCLPRPPSPKARARTREKSEKELASH